MYIVEFTAGSLRFVDAVPEQAPPDGFVWIYLDRADYVANALALQTAAQRLGGSAPRTCTSETWPATPTRPATTPPRSTT